MVSKEFEGSLDQISPRLILSEENSDDLQDFFLVLSLIFNDLKGLLTFREIIERDYRKPDPGETSVQMGEYSGLITQNTKLLISIVRELLLFLDKNKKIISTPRFQLIIFNLSPILKLKWAELCDVNDASEFVSKIRNVRHRIAFHYDERADELKRGFIRSFYAERKDLPQHKHAHFSLGSNMRSTRFYFADAAVEDYIHSLMSAEDINMVGRSINAMNETIRAIMEAYIRFIRQPSKKKKP